MPREKAFVPRENAAAFKENKETFVAQQVVI